MKCYEAPMELSPTSDDAGLFLAGGITGCPDWQRDALSRLSHCHINVFNPRRANFPIHDPSAAEAQIKWEHRYLDIADAIMFWFPCETLCPIVLYELGAWNKSGKRLFIGTHQNYQRRQDVVIQTKLDRPGQVIHGSFSALMDEVLTWAED